MKREQTTKNTTEKPVINKEDFVRLAKAFVAETEYLQDLDACFSEVAKKHKMGSDFLGLPIAYTLPLAEAVLDVIDNEYDDFGYFVYECNADFDKFNESITLDDTDEKHPNIQSFEELYDFIFPLS